MHDIVEAHASKIDGLGCFAQRKCQYDHSLRRYNRTTDCYIECFVQTVTGRDPIRWNATKVGEKMSAKVLASPLVGAFASNTTDKLGCPALSPYVSPE